MASDDEIVLSYKDCLLRKSDIALLKPGEWLNDAIISFWFEYLICEMYPSAADYVTLVGPEVCHLLKLTTEAEFPGLLQSIEPKRFVFFALNNQTDPGSVGGSHWSLLVFDSMSAEEPIIHLDSSRGCNRNSAQIFAQRLDRELAEPTVPQQENTSDCALYVCLFSETLCRYIGKALQVPGNEVSLIPLPAQIALVTSEQAREKRRELEDLIKTVAEMQKPH